MNKEKQRRRIIKFLKGKGNRDLDAFCIYQWVERCHFEGWWDLALGLRPSIPPNSLDEHYDKRLEYLSRECKNKLDFLKKEYLEVKSPHSLKSFSIPQFFWSTCADLGMKPSGRSKAGLRLDYLGTKVLFLENINLDGCILRLYKVTADDLYSWLRSHGFEDLSGLIIWPRKSSQTERSRLRVSWHDATNLAPSLFEELKAKVPGHKWINVVISKNWETWKDCVEKLVETLQPDRKDEEKRNAIEVLTNEPIFRGMIVGWLKDLGRDDLIKRLSSY